MGDDRRIWITDGNPEGAHVVLVDDLVQTGGTLINCAECMKKAGAVAVSCFATHAVFPNESWKKFVGGKGPFDTFFITDSIPQVSRLLASQPPFEVISLAPLLSESIFESISQ